MWLCCTCMLVTWQLPVCTCQPTCPAVLLQVCAPPHARILPKWLFIWRVGSAFWLEAFAYHAGCFVITGVRACADWHAIKVSHQWNACSGLAASKCVLCWPADAPREERDVLRRIREALDAVPDPSKSPDTPVLSVQSALDEQQPEIDTERRISLTW